MIDGEFLERQKTMSEKYRTFDTGATRDVDEDKLDFEGFLSPAVLRRFADYMHAKRQMPDGTVRDGDNWQKGIPLDAYIKSGHRHFMDWWCHHRGRSDLAEEDVETALCALMFNVMGYLHELLYRDDVVLGLNSEMTQRGFSVAADMDYDVAVTDCPDLEERDIN